MALPRAPMREIGARRAVRVRAPICFLSLSYRPGAQGAAQGCVRTFVNPTADDLKIGPRRDRQL